MQITRFGRLGSGVVAATLVAILATWNAQAQEGYRPPPDGGLPVRGQAANLGKPGALSPTGPVYSADQIRKMELAGVSLDMSDEQAVAALTGLNWAQALNDTFDSTGEFRTRPITDNGGWLKTPDKRELPFVERQAQVWRRAGEAPMVAIYRIRDAAGPVRPGRIEFREVFGSSQQSPEIWKQRLVERFGPPTRESKKASANETLSLVWEPQRQVFDWSSQEERDCQTPGQGGIGCNKYELRKLYKIDEKAPRLIATISPDSMHITLSDEGRIAEAGEAAKAHAEGVRDAARDEATKAAKPNF